MRPGRRLAALGLVAVLTGTACASSRRGSTPGAEVRDRTDDPELVAARQAARPEFKTQADALAAGVYEPFEHPDSVGPGPGAAPPVVPGLEAGPDPSTEELLGTLGDTGPYNAGAAPRGEAGDVPALDLPSAGEEWTLQLGAFESETGALVRIRQIAGDFPLLPRWYERGGGRVRVFVGRFADRSQAELERARVAEAGYPDAWVTRIP
ncbi:MAG: SPOR domain-containing protein [Gemmatimonadota bacterium]